MLLCLIQDVFSYIAVYLRNRTKINHLDCNAMYKNIALTNAFFTKFFSV